MHTTGGRAVRRVHAVLPAVVLAGILGVLASFLGQSVVAKAQTPAAQGPMTTTLVKEATQKMAKITPVFKNKRRVIYNVRITDNAWNAVFKMKVRVKVGAKRGWCRYHLTVQFSELDGEGNFNFLPVFSPPSRSVRGERGIRCAPPPVQVSMHSEPVARR